MDSVQQEAKQLQRRVLVIDGLNIFIRNFAVNETLNSHGEAYGGVVGFLRSLRNLVNLTSPNIVYVCWEAGGGSSRRKGIFSEYKENRAKLKIFSKTQGNIIDREKANNQTKQLILLNKILGTLPVCQVYVSGSEADDLVAYICKTVPGQKIVVSSDKDYYQLLSESDVKVYDPHRKIYITKDGVQEQFNISANNFCLAKTIVGDNSDNIPGIPGIGFKTLSKRIPEFNDNNRDLTISEVLDIALNNIQSLKKAPSCFKDIIEFEDIIRRNWKLMYLDIGCLSHDQTTTINNIINSYQPSINRLDYIKAFMSADMAITEDLDKIPTDLKFLVSTWKNDQPDHS